ncbi:hypothetical protein BJX61DRAFT_546515 [Aspergillus egyptiacus]|nr:hypothetical protein BJX61DRAFT_546515 [Aspergillus egyptiacus]
MDTLVDNYVLALPPGSENTEKRETDEPRQDATPEKAEGAGQEQQSDTPVDLYPEASADNMCHDIESSSILHIAPLMDTLLNVPPLPKPGNNGPEYEKRGNKSGDVGLAHRGSFRVIPETPLENHDTSRPTLADETHERADEAGEPPSRIWVTRPYKVTPERPIPT